MNILFLILTILFEVAGTTFLKLSQGFTKLIPSMGVIIFYGCSFYFLSLTLKRLEIGVIYAIWSGLGTALIVLVGVFWFKEPLTVLKAVSILLIISGVVGLNLGGAH